jgi:hypothetical protein
MGPHLRGLLADGLGVSVDSLVRLGVGWSAQHRATWQPQAAVIIADADAPGQRGARSLAARLVGYVPDGVRIVTPPAKDAREWVRAGADRLDILDAIEAAPTLTLSYTGRAIV